FARSLNPPARNIVLAASGLGVLAFVGVWVASNVTTNEWRPSLTLGQAIGEVALLSPVGRSSGLLLGFLAAMGIVQVVRMQGWWVLAAYSVSVGFFLFATWFPILSVRSLVVGVWYDDTTRVGALLAVWALPLARLGATTVSAW